MQVQRINNNNLCSRGLYKVTCKFDKSYFERGVGSISRYNRTIHYYPYFDETLEKTRQIVERLKNEIPALKHSGGNIYHKNIVKSVIHERLQITEQQAKNIAEITGVETNDLLPMILVQQAIAANKKI